MAPTEQNAARLARFVFGKRPTPRHGSPPITFRDWRAAADHGVDHDVQCSRLGTLNEIAR